MSAEKIREEALRWLETASILDKFYIPTRYPDGLPDLTPGKSYRKSEAITGLTAAKMILNFTEKYLC